MIVRWFDVRNPQQATGTGRDDPSLAVSLRRPGRRPRVLAMAATMTTPTATSVGTATAMTGGLVPSSPPLVGFAGYTTTSTR